MTIDPIAVCCLLRDTCSGLAYEPVIHVRHRRHVGSCILQMGCCCSYMWLLTRQAVRIVREPPNPRIPSLCWSWRQQGRKEVGDLPESVAEKVHFAEPHKSLGCGSHT